MTTYNTCLSKLWDNPKWFILLSFDGIQSLVICEGFEVVILIVKVQCTIACDLLVMDLECRILDDELMNVFGVIYPKYWL
jgi:hypothetical protein